MLAPVELERKIINYFALLKKREILGPAYIFIGSNSLVVNKLLKLINCRESQSYCGRCWSCRRVDDRHHPDLLVVEPEGLSIKVDSIRNAIRFLSLKGYYSSKKVLLIKDADKLTQESANLFLKTLEEPPGNSFIGLCVSKLEDVLPTINSRCRKIYLPFFSSHELKESSRPDKINPSSFFFGRSQARPFPKAAFFKERKDFALFLEDLVVSLHNQLKESLGSKKTLRPEKLIKGIEDIFRIYQAHNTVNINLALNLIKMRLR